jgi:AraC-like DNA-binding protein
MTALAKTLDRNRQAGSSTRAAGVLVSARAVRPLLLHVAAKGYDSSALLRDQGVDPAVFSDPDARLPHATAARLWPAASRLTNDADLGLHVAQAIRPGAFGVLDYAVRTSENLGAGFETLCRYHRCLHDVAEVKLTIGGGRATLSHRLPVRGGAPRALAEYIVAAWVVTSRQATGVNWTPLRVRFPHAAPENTAEHDRMFGCTVQFGHDCSELVFSRELLDIPLLKADSDLQAILEAQVVAALEKLPKGEATTHAVRRHLAGELSKGQPTLEQIAPHLHTSARTLHRRLEGEGTSFREILTEIRRELAARHLAERRLAIGEIAFMLGFSEPSAFHRAFKRWTGEAPLTYRRRATTGGAPRQ